MLPSAGASIPKRQKPVSDPSGNVDGHASKRLPQICAWVANVNGQFYVVTSTDPNSDMPTVAQAHLFEHIQESVGFVRATSVASESVH